MNFTFALPYMNPAYVHQPLRYVVSRLLRSHHIDVNADLLEQKLFGHPYFPSLLSVSDILNEVGVTHQTYRTTADTFLQNFSRPVLVFLTIGGGMFGVVEKMNQGKVRIFTEKGETRQYTLEEFTKAWDGVVLELTSSDEIKTKQLKNKDSYPKYVRYVMLSCWLLIAIYLLQNVVRFESAEQAILLLFTLAGASVSWLLVLQHLNKNNVLVKQLCESSTNKGCSSVLNSKAAQLTSWLSMAEAGFMFFSGGVLLLLFFDNPALYYYLALITPLFSVYALYLQAAVLREWCKLCMAVHGVLLAGFIVTVWHVVALPFRFETLSAGQLIVFVLPSLAWMAVKPFISQLKQGGHYKKEYRRLKANPELFNALLAKQVKVHVPEELKVFTFGKIDAPHELVFVSNPFCGPCGRAHSTIHEWLESELDFKVTVIFLHQPSAQDLKRQFVEFLSGLDNKEEQKQALHSWFEGDAKDLAGWADQYQLVKNPLYYDEEKLQHWLNLADVHATPAFFVNGHKLPDSYRLEDIRYLITEVNLLPKSPGIPKSGVMIT